MDLDNFEDTRKSTLIDDEPKNILCEAKIKKAVSAAIYKIFPQDLKNINKTLEQYNKAIKSNVLARFDYFNFEELDEKMRKIEEIDKMIRYVANEVKHIVEDIGYEKNNIKIEAEKWIDKIEDNGIRNIDAGQILFNDISNLKNQLKKIKKDKINIFNLTNVLLIVAIGATVLNSYKIFYLG